MEMLNFKKDFVQRTKEIVNENCNANNDYEVSLLINCLCGLVSLPTEDTDNSEEEFISEVVEKLKEMSVVKIQTEDKKTFRALKNALSHMHILVGNEMGKIVKVGFKDKLPGSDKFHTEFEFSVENLKDFALYVADMHLKRYEKIDIE